MSKVKTNIRKLNIPQKIAQARTVVTKLTGNASFPTPAPALAAVTTGADNLEAAYNAAIAGRITSKQLTSAMKDKEAALDALIIAEAAYVQTTSNGDKTKIESAGFETANPASPIGALPAPENVELDANVNPGNMGVRWEPVPGAASYLCQRAAQADVLDYVTVATPTSTKVTVNTMSSGTRYWFRIAAVGAAGPGEWTLPVSKIAP